MFKRPSTHYGKSPEPETPYQRAAQVWDDRIGSARVQAKNWRLMAFGSLALSAALSAGLFWQSMNGSIVPWVVQVDRLGQAQAIAPATADYQPNDAQIAFYLARFIEQVRGIPADAIEQLYSPFFRANNVAGRPGTGLGLAILKRSAKTLSATVEVATELDRGTTFTITLPAA